MKPKEIIEKANLSKGLNSRGSQELLFNILIDELKETYASYGYKDSERHFEAALKVVRSKWEAVSNKIPRGIHQGAWKFFYATRVAPLKGELCPTWKVQHDTWRSKLEEKYGKEEK